MRKLGSGVKIQYYNSGWVKEVFEVRNMDSNFRTRNQVRDFCLNLGDDLYEDYPFDDNWQAMRHVVGRKTMCLCYEYQKGVLWLNVKCDPDYREYWLKKYPLSIFPGYHQNKRHWLTLVLDGSIEDEDIETLLKNSYMLTKKLPVNLKFKR